MTTSLFKQILLGLFIASIGISCDKTEETIDKPNQYNYKTTTGKVIVINDSIDGELGDTKAQIIYSLKGTGHGISFKCYDQSYASTDTLFADVALYFAYTKQDIISGNYKDSLFPSYAVTESKNLGLHDSIYVKVVKDANSNDNLGKFSLKVLQNILPAECSETLVLNTDTFYTANQNVKPIGSKYFEKWYKVNVTPGKTYYLAYLRLQDSIKYTLSNFLCGFYEADGVSSHLGTSIVKNDQRFYSYPIPENQSILYIRCYTNTAGTNGIKITDIQP